MSVFVDSSVWFAAAATRDRDNALARSILGSQRDLVTTDHILVETWLLLNSRYRREVAELFWGGIRRAGVHIEFVTAADLEAAWAIGAAFDDQDFSVVDRTSFAVMERLGIARAASFDADFGIYRYGRNRERAFDIVRSGHSPTFGTLHQAVLSEKQAIFTYEGLPREVCPYVLGHKDGVEKLLAFQFGGRTSTGRLGWKCFDVSKVRDARLRDGPWQGDAAHRKTQRCVDDVYIDVNTEVPNQPGRR